ncbi:MAG: hypothetical protein AAF950_09045 [Pseudomonadota bacterium]
MLSLSISIETEQAAAAFSEALRNASIVARDMIVVQTSIRDGALFKTIKTECPEALATILQSQAGSSGDD